MNLKQIPGIPLGSQVDLSNCDREPIHIPAKIQAFGAMLVVQLSNKQVLARSNNAHEWLSSENLPSVGSTLQTSLLTDLITQVQQCDEGVPTSVRLVREDGRKLLATGHHVDGLAIIEIELDNETPEAEAHLLRKLFAGIERKSVEVLYQSTVDVIREFIGFDRVMLYQFHEDQHGSVIAEAKCDDQEPFLGLHYPAGDIPEPARRLYELKWVRTIADSHATPVEMQPSLVTVIAGDGERDAQPINLSFSNLRAISPIHLEYLRNMGVAASMSISVLSGGKLWGLIACHNRTPRVVTPHQRDTCELAGSLLSAYLSSRRQEELLKLRVQINENIAEQLAGMSKQDDFVSSIAQSAPWIANLFRSDGFIWVHGDDRFYWGETPTEMQTTKLLDALDQQNQEPIVYTDKATAWRSDTQSFAGRLPGLMVLRLGQRVGGALLLFRAPYMTSVQWAGDPKRNEADESGRLSPRKSFAKFTQTVQDRSLPWSAMDRETAETLLSTLNSMVVEQASRMRRANEELRQLNADLDAFAYAASHDLKEPLRGIRHHLFMLEQAGDLVGPAFDRGLSSLKRLVGRMSDLLDGLLRFSRAGRQELHWEAFLLSEVVEQARDVAFGGMPPSEVEIKVIEDGQFHGDFSCVREVISNLLTNAVKYNTQPIKQIVLSCVDVVHSPLARNLEFQKNVVRVRDNGIGIPADSQQRIFDIFTRLHGHADFGGGSGAGLTIVRRMVERHGGKIAIESDGRNGSTFYFGWPPQ